LPKLAQGRATHRQHLVDRGLELGLPVAAGGTDADVTDAAEVAGDLTGDSEKAVGLEEGDNLAELAEVEEAFG
jgi:hypothetical protein